MSSRQDNLRNLLCSQRKDIPDKGLYGKLQFEDMKRLDMCISGDIIISDKCCLYIGQTVSNRYCTFSFRGKKTSILRMLYHNFVDDIEPDLRLKYTCENKGLCCNLSHFDMESEETPEIEESLNEQRENPENEKIEENIFKFDDG